MKCSKCGAELSEGTKYCSYCGAKIETNDDQTANDQTREETEEALEKETENSSCSHENNIKMEIPKMHHQETEKNLSNRAKEKGANIWKNLSLFGKVSTVLIAIFVILCIISFVAGNVLGIAISALQIIIVVLAIMIHKEVIKVPQGWIKFLLLGIALLLTFVNIFNFTKGKEKTMAVTGADGPEEISIETSESAPYKLEKGTEFAYGTDEWNVYIATAISDSMIKIENWNKSSSSSKKVKKEYEVGTFKINDTENGFSWTDKDHLSFSFNLKDKDCSAFKKSQSIIFTININEGDVYKGTDYNEDIASYKFECDDWHMYRAIPLNENVLKIECWSRGSSSGRFIYGYDVCLINQKKTKSDFAWTDDERTSFTITMKDPDNNYYWKKANFVTFEKEEGSKVADVKTFLGKQTAAEDEAKVPKTAADYTHENYKDVMKEFQDAGFTDIKENVLYDIVFGITDEGEVDSVSVDGKEDFIKGEVFKKNAPIVITYHMKEEKDPSKVHTPYNSSELPEINYEDAKKAFVDAGFTNITVLESETSGGVTDGNVKEIEVDGSSSFDKEDGYKADVEVIIWYYLIKEAGESTDTTTEENNASTPAPAATTLDKYVAEQAFENYGEAFYPKFKCHWLADLRNAEQSADGSWYFKVGVSIKNTFGTKYDTVAEGIVSGTDDYPTIESFYVNEK